MIILLHVCPPTHAQPQAPQNLKKGDRPVAAAQPVLQCRPLAFQPADAIQESVDAGLQLLHPRAQRAVLAARRLEKRKRVGDARLRRRLRRLSGGELGKCGRVD
jgi:ABC-type dipeptide/oligopeptide/nickel transport system ATPase subunit